MGSPPAPAWWRRALLVVALAAAILLVCGASMASGFLIRQSIGFPERPSAGEAWLQILSAVLFFAPVLLLALLAHVGICLIPYWIATASAHPHATAILVTGLILGPLGWKVALIWSLIPFRRA